MFKITPLIWLAIIWGIPWSLALALNKFLIAWSSRRRFYRFCESDSGGPQPSKNQLRDFETFKV